MATLLRMLPQLSTTTVHCTGGVWGGCVSKIELAYMFPVYKKTCFYLNMVNFKSTSYMNLHIVNGSLNYNASPT